MATKIVSYELGLFHSYFKGKVDRSEEEKNISCACLKHQFNKTRLFNIADESRTITQDENNNEYE